MCNKADMAVPFFGFAPFSAGTAHNNRHRTGTADKV
jgi:hypothetical protein